MTVNLQLQIKMKLLLLINLQLWSEVSESAPGRGGVAALLFLHTCGEVGEAACQKTIYNNERPTCWWGRHLTPTSLTSDLIVRVFKDVVKRLSHLVNSSVAGPKEWEGVDQAEVGPGQFLWRWARHLHQLQQERQTQPVLAVRPLTSVLLIFFFFLVTLLFSEKGCTEKVSPYKDESGGSKSKGHEFQQCMSVQKKKSQKGLNLKV